MLDPTNSPRVGAAPATMTSATMIANVFIMAVLCLFASARCEMRAALPIAGQPLSFDPIFFLQLSGVYSSRGDVTSLSIQLCLHIK